MTAGSPLSRIAALGLLAISLVLAYELVASPLIGLYTERASRIDTMAERVARIKVRAEDTPALEHQLADLQANHAQASPFWSGKTDTVAAAGLLERIKTLLQREGATIQSTDVSSPTSKDSLHRIGVKVRFEAEIDQLQRALHAIEVMKPALMVSHLAVRHINSTRPEPQPLAVELDVYGLAAPTGVDPNS